MVSKLSPVVQIEQSDDNNSFTVTSKTAIFSREEKFTPGQEFEVPQMDGSKSKVSLSTSIYSPNDKNYVILETYSAFIAN